MRPQDRPAAGVILHKSCIPCQRGATLIVSLVMLLIVLIIGSSLAGMAQMGQKAARNERDRQIALHAAESALTDAEADIEGSTSVNSRSRIFSRYSSLGFSEECAKGDSHPYQGLCTHQKGHRSAWRMANIVSAGSNSPSVQFGRFTGKTLPSGNGPFPAQLPRYIIELIPDTTAGDAAGPVFLYRITAIGFGSSSATHIVLQSFYRKTDDRNSDSDTPNHTGRMSGRLSWREIPNWHDITAARK